MKRFSMNCSEPLPKHIQELREEKKIRTVDVTVSIPVSEDASPFLILKLLAETIENRVSEIDDSDGDVTVADVHGFGGNTITLTCGDQIEEVCL